MSYYPEEADVIQLPPDSSPAALELLFEDLPSTRFTWNIENFSTLKDNNLLSDPFDAGGYKWQLLISFPEVNNLKDHLSLYIQAVDSTKLPYGCNIYAKLSLAVVNQVSRSYNVQKDTEHHEFSNRYNDWGHRWFMPLSELYDDGRGYVINDKCVIEADVTVRQSVRSKLETGYVGLKCIGSTCYVHSLLQTLYHIPYFRKAVFYMPRTGNDMESGSIPLSLQSLFYNLEYSDTSVATDELTKSFGPDTHEYFQKNDAQEYIMVLFEKLQEKMKGTVVEGAIQQLFEGHTMRYVDYPNLGYRSSRIQNFTYLQLDVEGCRHVYDSFNKYVEVRQPEAEINRYDQDLFVDFPPVLVLELKRFRYDYSMEDTVVKINDDYRFPFQLDLDIVDGKYLSPLADRSVRNLYTLHSVWAHSGDVHDGHYFANIRPTLSDQWFKFDDERVIDTDMKRAVFDQYGGEEVNNYTENSNAYMLVYIRESEKAEIFCNVDETDMAEHLQVRLYEDEPHLCTTIKVISDTHLNKQIGKHIYFDLVDFDRVGYFRFRKHASFALFQDKFACATRIPVRRQQFWLWEKRQGPTYRPYRPLTSKEKDKTVEYIRKFSNRVKNAELHLYLELDIALDLVPFPHFPPPEKSILLFFKLYDPVKEKLRFLVRFAMRVTAKLGDIVSPLEGLADFRHGSAEIALYEEMSSEPLVMCIPLDKELTFEENHLEDGDIICFQKVVPDEFRETLRFPDFPSFMQHARDRQLLCLEDEQDIGDS